MTSLIKIRNEIFYIIIILGVVGLSGLLFLNVNYALSFLFGCVVGLGYIWHLSNSVVKFNAENKSINSITRLAFTIVFMVLIGQILSLNIVFICLGFLCNHFAMLFQVVFQLIRDRIGQSCK